MDKLRNNRLIRAGGFLLVTVSPAIAFIALLRILSDPILSWISQHIRPYLGEKFTIAIFFLINAVIFFVLLYEGLALAWRLVKPNLAELNAMIAQSENAFGRRPKSAARRYYFNRLVGLEAEREERFGIPAPKREPFPTISGR